MGSTNTAMYGRREVTAAEVMRNYAEYGLSEFKCTRCGVQVAFNRGTAHEHPHFKNWPNVDHRPGCPVPDSDHFIHAQDTAKITTLISTILKNAKRLEPTKRSGSGHDRATQLSGPSTRKMVYQLSSITNHKFEVLQDCADVNFQTEDGQKVKVKDLILTQDEAKNRLATSGPFIGIVRGGVGDPFAITPSGYGCRASLPTNPSGKYGNRSKFNLYIPERYVDLNKKHFDLYQHCLILCYGEIELYNGVPQMKIYSIPSQVVRGLTFTS